MQHFLCMHVCNISYACMQHFLRNVAYSIKCSVCASYSVQCRTAVLCMKKEKEGKGKVNLSGSKYVSSSHLNKGKYLMPGTKWTLKVRYELWGMGYEVWVILCLVRWPESVNAFLHLSHLKVSLMNWLSYVSSGDQSLWMPFYIFHTWKVSLF